MYYADASNQIAHVCTLPFFPLSVRQTFDILIVALFGVVQRDNDPRKDHNAAKKRHNVTTPESRPQHPTSAISRIFATLPE
jgi:hypothetical protein